MLSKYSHSSLETFRQCPRKYWFQKIEKPSVPRRLFAHNHLGNAVHHQLKVAYQRALDGRLYPLEEMLRAFEAVWEGDIRLKVVTSGEHQTIDDEIENGRRMLRTYYRRYQPFDQGQLKLTEQMLNFELPNCPAGLHAKPDRVWARDDGVVEICDYKTGKQMVAGAQDPKFRLQMGLYHLAVRSAFPQFEQIEVAQYFLRHDEVVRTRLRPDELDELAEQFRSELHQIANAERLGDWPEQESGLCSFCDYVHLCPKKRHKVALESENDARERTSAEQAAALADRYLHCNDEKKAAEAELKALRVELLAAAKDLKISKLYGSEGYVSVSVRPVEKLPARTKDPAAFAQLVYLVREKWKLEECLTLDASALLKDFYGKGRLTDEQVSELEPHIIRKDDVRVTSRRTGPAAADDED